MRKGQPLSLDEKIKRSIQEAQPEAPSFHPVKRAPKVEVEALPDLREAIASPAIRMKVLRLVGESLELHQVEKEAANKRSAINKELKEIMKEHSTTPGFMVDGNRVKTFETSRRSISRQKLLDNNVLPHIIDASTTVSISLSLKITPPGEETDDEYGG